MTKIESAMVKRGELSRLEALHDLEDSARQARAELSKPRGANP
jgi:hypothetical protein